jgi:Protein of unknown function (DUF1579)
MGNPMSIEIHQDQLVLSRLVGCWEGRLRHRAAEDQPFQEIPGHAENRWLLGGRFVEMTLRGGAEGDGWSAVFYIGCERSERRCVLVSLEPGERRVTIRRGHWTPGADRLVLLSRHRNTPSEEYRQSRLVCDLATPGKLNLELAEGTSCGQEFVRFKATYGSATAAAVSAPLPRRQRRFVIA